MLVTHKGKLLSQHRQVLCDRLISELKIKSALFLPGSGPSPTPLHTLNSFLAGSLFLPAMLDTKTLNSYLDPPCSPVMLYSCPLIPFREFQRTNLPSALALLNSMSYMRLGSPPSRGGRVHFSMKLVVFSHVTVLVMLNSPLGGPGLKSKEKYSM